MTQTAREERRSDTQPITVDGLEYRSQSDDPRIATNKMGRWAVTSGSVDLLNTYWQNASGVQSIDLAGLAPGTITQTLTLPYTARFKYAGNPEGLPVKKHMLVTADAPGCGSPVSISKVFDTTNTTISAMGWKSGKLTFSGTAGDVVTLTFQDTDNGTSNGIALDAISMTASCAAKPLNHGNPDAAETVPTVAVNVCDVIGAL